MVDRLLGVPVIFLDCDYDTFTEDDMGDFHLWGDEVGYDGPEYVYLEGYPDFGRKLDRSLARRVGPMTYRIV